VGVRRAVHDVLFREHPDGTIRLIGGYSPSSGYAHFPRLAACPFTGADDVEEVELPDHASLWGWTAVTAPPPGYRGEVPFGFGIVQLPGDLRIITRLTVADPDALSFGQEMRLVAVPLHDDDGTTVITYAFEPAEAS
jgi:uncharacterized OB-fold protein